MGQTSFLGGFWGEEHGALNDFQKFEFFSVTGPLFKIGGFFDDFGVQLGPVGNYVLPIWSSIEWCSTDSRLSDIRRFDFLWWNKVHFRNTKQLWKTLHNYTDIFIILD